MNLKNFKSILIIYRNLRRSKGIKLVLRYFFECHLFDLLYKTNTHKMLSKNDMKSDSKYFENSLMYMASWTSTLKISLTCLRRLLGDSAKNYSFIDIGCGKGKVILIARNLGVVGLDPKRYIGIDFEPSLIRIAQNNSIKMFGDKGKFILNDALDIDYQMFGNALIFFLYNPFDDSIIKIFLKKVSKLNPILVYVNPVGRDLIIDAGYQSLARQQEWHPNLCFEIFKLAS